MMSRLLVYIMATGLCDALQRSSLWFNIHKNYFHPGEIYRSYTVKGTAQCVQHCMVDLACMSFNLNKTSHGLQCNLLGEIWQEGELIPDQATDFYGKEKSVYKTLCFKILYS